MKFIYEEEAKEQHLTFDMVESDQFFVNNDGCLCQKVHDDRYNVLSNYLGEPFAFCHDCEKDEEIQRILPKVVKIEF